MKTLIADVPEKELVERSRKGDVDAFSELARRNWETIYRIIYRHTGNPSDTDDLLQETFFRAFRAIKRFKGKSSFSTWVFRIAINQSLNFLKKKKKEKQMETFEDRKAWGESSWSTSPDSKAISRELRAKLEEAVDSLPLAYRSTFILVALEGMKHNQVAKLLGCSENTVSWRVHKARKIIQAKLEPYLGEVNHGL